MELILHPVDLAMRHVFTIAHGSRTVQSNVIVELREGGISGYGETASSTYFGVTAESVCQALEAVRRDVEQAAFDDPPEFRRRMAPLLKGRNFALCALDEAAHDLWGKRLGRKVYELWGLESGACPLTNYTIGIDTAETMVARMKEFDGWPIYKIKLGTPDDLVIVRELRRHTDAVFRVDANTAWGVEETIRNSRELKKLGVEFIEQPLRADDWEGMKRVYGESALPIIADESCVAEEDVDRCRGCFHGVNVKLTKAGGLTPARRMVRRARELGLKTMAGCMTESTVGISAVAQLLPMLDYADVDGALLLVRDVAAGVRIEMGRAVFGDENGCGVRWIG